MSHNIRVRFSWYCVVVCFIMSCGNTRDKPVYEKLNQKELQQAITKDTSFGHFYDLLCIYEANVITKEDKAKYDSLSYARLFSYYKFIRDSTLFHKTFYKAEIEWKEKYSTYFLVADSIINYWKQRIADSDPKSYVTIELVDIKKVFWPSTNIIKEIYLGFRFTPLRGDIQQVAFSYSYEPKVGAGSLSYRWGRNAKMSRGSISKPAVQYFKVDHSIDLSKPESAEEFFANETASTFLRDYNLFIRVEEVRKDGINIKPNIEDVPEDIYKYLNVKKYRLDSMYKAKEVIIKKTIDGNYVSKDEYLSIRIREVLMSQDYLSYQFIIEKLLQPGIFHFYLQNQNPSLRGIFLSTQAYFNE